MLDLQFVENYTTYNSLTSSNIVPLYVRYKKESYTSILSFLFPSLYAIVVQIYYFYICYKPKNNNFCFE